MTPLINVEIYTKEFSDQTTITAKQAKELFFLTPNDLSYLDHERPKGWEAYAMKTGSCKYFRLVQVRRMAIETFGSVQALVAKAEALNQRRTKKVERDRQKRLDEEQRRREAQAAAEKARLDAIAERKQKTLEKKRAAELQAHDAESWRRLVRLYERQQGGDTITEIDIEQLIQDAVSWRQHQQQNSGPATKKQKVQVQVEANNSTTPKARISP